MNKLFMGFILIMAGMPLTAASVIRVADYGAKVDDGKSDTSAIRKAIAACKKKKSSKLVFEKGVYDLNIPSKAKADWRGGFPPYFTLRGMDKLSIEGNGAELKGHDLAGFFNFVQCKNILIRELILDMDPLPFAGGRVIAANGNQFDLQVAPGHKALAGRRNEGVLGYDSKNRRLAIKGIDSYQTAFMKKTEIVKPGVMRVFVQHQLPNVGADVIVRHQIYCYNGFNFSKCENITLRDVTIYAVAGMGVYGYDSTNFTLQNFKAMIRPGSGRWMSTTADATHFNTCRGTITLEDCLFEGMGDDATNLHLMFMEITGKPGPRSLRLTTRAREGQWLPVLPRVGDKLEIGGGANPLLPYCTVTVASVKTNPSAKEVIVSFDEDLPAKTAAGHIVANASASPKARIRNCVVRNNRARGMLIQTRDVVLENNRFEYCSGAALHIASDVNYWKEGIGVRNVKISNNSFLGCNFGAARRGAVVDIFAEVGKKLASAGVHRGIVLANNKFKDSQGSDIHINSADGVEIKSNTFSNPKEVAIFVNNSRNVQIIENQLQNGSKGGLNMGKNCDRTTISSRDNKGFK